MENISTENTTKSKKGIRTFILIVVAFLAIIVALKFLMDAFMK
jgi:hypothetical protein